MRPSIHPFAALRSGWEALREDRGAVPAGIVLTLLFFLAQCIVIGMTGVAAADRVVREGGEVAVPLSIDAPLERSEELRAAMAALSSVESVTLLTRDRSLERARLRDPSLPDFLERFGLGQPFDDALLVRLRSTDAYDPLMTWLRDPAWSDVVDGAALAAASDQQSLARGMLATTGVARLVGGVMTVVVLLALGAAVIAIIWRRGEMDVMAQTVLLLLSLAAGTLAVLLALLGALLVVDASVAWDSLRGAFLSLLVVRLPITTLLFAALCPLMARLGVMAVREA